MKLIGLLRVYRAFNLMKLKAFAAELGISPKELTAIEDGKIPKGDVLAKILTWALAENGEQKPSEAKKEGESFNGQS